MRREFRISAKNGRSHSSILLIAIMLLSFASLSSEVFPIRYHLRGAPRIENGLIDIFKIPPGYSSFRSQAKVFDELGFITKVTTDYENRLIKLEVSKGMMKDFYPVVTMDMDTFYQQHYRRVFRSLLYNKSIEHLGEEERSAKSGLIGEFTFKLPPSVKKSRFARSILGNKAGSLSLDGSEKVTIGGSSSRTNSVGNEDGDNIDFDLNMKQDLILNLRGTIGEKIHVNVDHRSTSGDEIITNPSTVEISYEGTEDEIIKRIEGGNISLALSGSKYISYSASSEGLFGIKSDMEVGNLDLTLILGKDEAKKETQKWQGNAKTDSTAIPSENYMLRKFFYITDPADLFLLYGDPEGDAFFGTDYPPTYADNAIRTDGGDWILAVGANDLLPQPGTLHVYFDDNTDNNQNETTSGVNDYDDADGNTYSFMELLEGTDFTFDYDMGVLYVNRTINKQHSIAVIYEQNDGTQVGYYDAAEELLHVKVIKLSNQNVDDDPEYWKLEARNIYDLIYDYQSEDFELYVFDDTASDGTQTTNCPAEVGAGFAETYNDYLRLDTNGDEVINAEDEPISLASRTVSFAFLEPFYSLGDQIVYEKDPTSIIPDDYIMYISVRGKSGRNQVNLETMNVLPGSVKITMGEGATKKDLKENVDYIVDYDFGLVTFLTDEARDAEAILNITFDHKDIFSVDNTTLAGVRADWEINENASVGGTFIYHNEQINEDHPQIGGENITLILSDIDGRLQYELPFITKAIDWLPLINTDEESSITLDGEVAMSIPKTYGNSDNPEEAYIDDMETILDSYPLGVVRSGWSPASQPYEINYPKSSPNWFNAQNIYRKDVYNPESLTEDEETEEIPVLGIRLRPPSINIPGMENRYWGGLMKNIGNQVDLSNKQYIEVLVKVDSTHSEMAPVIMHVNLGDINEDFYTDFGGEGVLNSEDGVNGGFTDGELDQYGSVNEDIGLDMIPNGEPGDDPDDNFDNEEVGGEYPYINGTENNDRLDTEDLDNNGELNTTDVYFDYAVTLKDTSYLESIYNGWHLYRIPIQDSDSYNIISNSTLEPNLERINYARIWFETQEEVRINIVNLDLIGNKWEENYIRDEDDEIISIFELESNREKMQSSVIDNQKNIHYTPAPGSVIKEGNEETLEQSMFIDYTNLQPGHHGLVRQKFQNTLGLISYEKIRFWVYSERFAGDEEELAHNLIIRIGKDSLNYYEINKPLTANEYHSKMREDGWIDLEFDFSELTYLKSPDEDDSTYVKVDNYYSYYYDGDTRYEMHKAPTLSYIEEISLGVENTGDEEYNGRVYFNDIRVAYPYNAVGYATRGDINIDLADLASIDLSAEWKTDNFKSRAERKTTSSGNTNTYRTTTLDASTNISLHKFFPAQWGFNIPLTLSRTELYKKGRFKDNSDILWEDLNEDDQEREKTHNLKYKADLNLSLSKSPNTPWKIWNGFVNYTFKSTSINSYIEKKMNSGPTLTDTTLTYQVKHTYNLKLPKDKLSLGILKNYDIGLFPQSFSNSLTYKAELPNGRVWRYNTTGDSAYWEPKPNIVNDIALNTSSTVKYDILSDVGLEYSLKTKRDMLLEKKFQDVNIGTEKTRDQSIKVKYTPKYIDNVFTLSSNLSIDYDDKTKKKSYDSDEDDFYYEGGVDRDFKTNVTLKNHDLMQQFVNWVWKDRPKDPVEPEEGIKPVEEKPNNPEEEFQKELEEEKILTDEELAISDTTQSEKETRKSLLAGINPIKALTQYIGGLENIQISFDNSYRTDYDDLEARPSFAYQLGFPHILREEDEVDSLTGDILEKEIEMRQDGNQISVSTGFPIMKNLSTQLSYDWQLTQKYTSSPTQTLTVNFPNVRVQLSEFNTLLGIEEILKSSSLSSNYSMTNKKTGVVDWVQPTTEEITINLSPVLSWSANWEKNVTSHVNLNHRQTDNITYRETGDVTRKSTSQSASGDISWSFSAEKGIKMPFTERRLYIKNDTTLRLDASYERRWGSTIGNDGSEQKDEEQTNLTVRPQISYDFSKSITAGLTSEYKINNNIKNSIKVTTFSLSMWVEVVF